MNIHFGNQSQFELFPKTTGDSIENVAPRFIFSRIILSFENLVVAFVFVIVSLIIAYSFGVAYGRRVTLATHSGGTSMTPLTGAQSTVVSSHPGMISASGLAVNQMRIVPAGETVALDPQRNIPAVRAIPAAGVAIPASRAIVPVPGEEKVVDKGYTIQVASYKKEIYAQKETGDLKSQGWQDSLIINKGNYTIVCIGHYASQEQAKSAFNKLKRKYKDCRIRSL